MSTPMFLNITVQCKGSEKDNDWRAFLHWGDSDAKMMYAIRGYGETPGDAANDAYRRFNEDPIGNVTDEYEWK